MPRRRAVRLIGTALAAAAVPGVSPRLARAAMGGASQTPECARGILCCWKLDRSTGKMTVNTCPYPGTLWECIGPDNLTCHDRCATVTKATGKLHTQTWSSDKDAGGNPKRSDCCPRPETIPQDGRCLPNCKLQLGPTFFNCGETCCPSHMRCVKGECRPCEADGGHSCQPARTGAVICCAKGTKCCFNNTTTACCGPMQTCRAKKSKTAHCVCDSGTKCGADCCKKGERCCSGKDCCPKSQDCCNGECCPAGAVCCDLDCCDPARNEFCLAKVVPGQGRTLSCKKGCSASNRCGAYCCGTGTRCVKGQCVK